MSWLPGVGPIKDIGEYGISKGLSEDWYSSDNIHRWNRDEIKTGNFWAVKDNPLYEVAAGGLGWDWDDWVKNAESTAVTGSTQVHAKTKEGYWKKTRTRYYFGRLQITRGLLMHMPNRSTSKVWVAPEYAWMTLDQAKSRGLSYTGPKTTFESGRDWYVTDATIAKDLDKMSDWLNDIVTVNDHLHPIIREGPKGEHYGIAGDIWEHYGLDQEPEPIKELDWDSYDKKMQLNRTVKSNVSYSTPKGLQKVNLHGG